jgi:hypothetical protein
MRFYQWLEERQRRKAGMKLLEKFEKSESLSFREFVKREAERLDRQTEAATKISTIVIAATVIVQLLSLAFAIISAETH